MRLTGAASNMDLFSLKPIPPCRLTVLSKSIKPIQRDVHYGQEVGERGSDHVLSSSLSQLHPNTRAFHLQEGTELQQNHRS